MEEALPISPLFATDLFHCDREILSDPPITKEVFGERLFLVHVGEGVSLVVLHITTLDTVTIYFERL